MLNKIIFGWAILAVLCGSPLFNAQTLDEKVRARAWGVYLVNLTMMSRKAKTKLLPHLAVQDTRAPISQLLMHCLVIQTPLPDPE